MVKQADIYYHVYCTGSGKTYTMEGPPNNRGVNYRTLQQLFNTVHSRREQTTFSITVSLLEVIMHSMNTSSKVYARAS